MTPPRPPKEEEERKGTTLGVRFSGAELARLDRLVEALTAQAVGVEVTRTAAMRAALSEGFDVLEERLGLNKKKTKR